MNFKTRNSFRKELHDNIHYGSRARYRGRFECVGNAAQEGRKTAKDNNTSKRW